MWRFVTIFLLFLGLRSIESATIRSQEDFLQSLEGYFHRNCLRNAINLAFERLKLNVDTLLISSGDGPALKTNEDLYNFVCKRNISKNYKDLEDLMTPLEPCLGTEEKFVTDFVLTTYNSSHERQCADGLDDFTDRVSKIKNADCENIRDNAKLISRFCVTDVVMKNFDFDSEISITQDFFCGKLQATKDCLVDGLKDVCTDDVLPDIMTNGYQPYLDWCGRN